MIKIEHQWSVQYSILYKSETNEMEIVEQKIAKMYDTSKHTYTHPHKHVNVRKSIYIS